MIDFDSIISISILSLFCLGGIIAYYRESTRLHKLIVNGIQTEATIMKKEKIESGESVTHYIVTYQFCDEYKRKHVHEQDLNSQRYFDGLNVGDNILVVYQIHGVENSYPFSQIENDLRRSRLITLLIVAFWIIISTFLYLK
jgi:hypothetical protein